MHEKVYSIILTNRCNLRCSYCYSGNSLSTSDMPEKTVDLTLNHIMQDIEKNDINPINVVFEGNEPSLVFSKVKKIVLELKKRVKNRGLYFGFFSNLQSIDDHMLSFLKENDIQLHTSIDGPEFLHDAHRGKNSFKKASFWIKKARVLGLRITASCTICKDSLPFFKEIVDTFLSLGIVKFNFRYLHKLGAGKVNWHNLGYTPLDFIDFYKKAINYIFYLNFTGHRIIETKSIFIYSKIRGYKKLIEAISPPCDGFKYQLLYDPLGDIYTCDEGRNDSSIYRLGNVVDGIDLQKVDGFYKNLDLAKKSCGSCEINSFCGPCIALNSPVSRNCTERCIVTKFLMTYIGNFIKDKNLKDLFELYTPLPYNPDDLKTRTRIKTL